MKVAFTAFSFLSLLMYADSQAVGSFDGNVAGSGSFNNDGNQVGNGGEGIIERPMPIMGGGGGMGPMNGGGMGPMGGGGMGPMGGGGMGPMGGGGMGGGGMGPMGGGGMGPMGGGIGPAMPPCGNHYPRRWGYPSPHRRPFSYGPYTGHGIYGGGGGMGGGGMGGGGMGGGSSGSFNNNANTYEFAAKTPV